MSKNLRVFLLSVLVVVLCASAALAETISKDTWQYDTEAGFLTLSDDGKDGLHLVEVDKWTKEQKASFDAINSIDISSDRAFSVQLNLPPVGKTLGGTSGDWVINISADSAAKARSLTINPANENAGIVLGVLADHTSWEVGPYTTLTINTPIRARSQDYYINLKVSGDGAVAHFGANADINDDHSNLTKPTGFGSATRSSFDVSNKGTLIISNRWALTGSLDVKVSEDSTLVLNLPNGTYDLQKASIDLDGGTIQVNNDITLTNATLKSTAKKFKKTGKGTLTLGESIMLSEGDMVTVSVDEGKLYLVGKPNRDDLTKSEPSFKGSFDIHINDNAILEVGFAAIQIPDAGGVSFEVVKSGKLILNQHSVRSDTVELYPYDRTNNDNNYEASENNSMTFHIKSVDINVSDDASELIVNGIQAVNKIKGSGIITVNGSKEVDDAVLILVGADYDNYKDFKGTINGTNIGLYDVGENASDPGGEFDPKIFKDATLSLDNLLVYGRTKLIVDYFTINDSSKVTNFYLRSFRPATSKGARLEVGSLIFKVSKDQNNISYGDSKVRPITVDGLKVDAAGEYTRDNNTKHAVLSLDQKVYLNISNVELYANRDTDYNGAYPASTNNKMEALEINGTAEGSHINWDGSGTKGDGVVVDGFYPITVTASTDIYISGERPFATGNSVSFGTDADVEVEKGAIFGGNVFFEGTKNSRSTFTTTIGKTNRETNVAGDYSVIVEGNLAIKQNQTLYICAEPDDDAFDGIGVDTGLKTTAGQRFRVIGTNTGTFSDRKYYTVDEDKVFGLGKPEALRSDEKGVILECQKELALISLGDWEFIKGGKDFGLGAKGEEFAIKIPYSVTWRGASLLFEEEVDEATKEVRHYLGIDGARFYAVPYVMYGNERVEYISSKDIGMLVEFNYVSDTSPDQYIRLVGTATSETVPNVELTLCFDGFVLAADTVGVMTLSDDEGVTSKFVRAKKSYTFVREGATPPVTESEYSSAKTEIIGDVDVTVGEVGNVKFTVEGLRDTTYSSNASVPTLVNGVYVWKNTAVKSGAYYLPDKFGRDTRVKNLTLIRYNGEYNKRTTTSDDIGSDFDFTINGSTIEVEKGALGTTGTAFSAVRGLAIQAERDDNNGKIITVPVSYTLHAKIDASNTESIGSEMSKTVTIGGESVGGHYDIDPDVLSDNVHFIAYDMPEWLGYSQYDRGFGYNTGNITDVEPGEYTFKVLAYSGDDATTSNHVLYYFTINVKEADEPAEPVEPVEPEVPAITADKSEVTVTLPDGTDTVTFTLTGGAAGLAMAENTNPAGLVTLDGTAATISAAGVEAGTYTYTFTATAESGDVEPFTLTVTVAPEPTVEFGIDEVYNGFDDALVDGHTYYATFKAVGAAGDVTWTVSNTNEDGDTFTYNNANGDLVSVKSGDLFVVEGTVKAGEEQGFVVKATDGTNSDEDEIEFDVDEDEVTSYTTLEAASGSHTAVAEGYQVDFPAGIVADEDSVFLPSWLKPVLNADGEVTGVEFAGAVGDLPNGTKAMVYVEAENDDGDEFYYSWEVTYNAQPSEPLALSASSPTLTVKAGETGTVNLTVENAVGEVTYTFESSPAGVTVSVADGVATFTAPATADSYTVTITATDDRGADGAATVSVAVTVPPAGGETPGGETPGPGGETPGGETPGGETPGPGGETPGGETPGGETPGDNNQSGNNNEEPGDSDPGSSGGGCDAGFGALALALAAPLFLRRRRS